MRLLTNSGLILIHIFEHRRSTLREISTAVGITDRAATSILRRLTDEGWVSKVREGRNNHYTVILPAILASQAHGRYTVREIVNALASLLDQLEEERPQP